MMDFAGKRVHLMGIGGCGVSALVPLLQQAGAEVSGCDLSRSATVQRLRKAGIWISIGHDPAHGSAADIVVHTSAVEADHAELRAARAAGALVLTRPACLAELMRGHRTVAIAGSHGKTTTTWLTGHLLAQAGVDPVVMVGGSVPGLGNAGTRLGRGAWFVAEVDESDGGFAHVDPTVAVVTNLDDEHLGHYGGRAGLEAAFANWLNRVPADGCAVVTRGRLPESVLAGVRAPVFACGVEQGDYRAVDVVYGSEGVDCRVVHRDTDLGAMHVPLPGRHNLENALCAVAAARCVQSDCRPAELADCERVGRRFTVHGAPRGVRVVEDYAHHPTELAAVISAAACAGGGVHVLFQPHRYSRTQECFDGFVHCFDAVASLTMLPIYAASEEALPGISARRLAEAIGNRHAHGRVQYSRSSQAALRFIASAAKAGDTILVCGAGDVNRLIPTLLEMLG